MDSIESKIKKAKAYKNNLTRLNHEMEIQKAIEQRKKVKIVDIKKNTGLIGMKIKRPDVDFDKNFGKNNNKNIMNEPKTNTTHSRERVSKKLENKQKVKTKTNLKKKDGNETCQSKPKKYIERSEKNKELFLRKPKEDLPGNVDKFDKEKHTDRNVIKPSMSKSILPKEACRDVEESLVQNAYETETDKLKEAVLTFSSENKKCDQINFTQMSILEKYTNLKEKRAKCGNRIMTQKNSKENDKNDDNGQSDAMKATAEQSNAKTNYVMKQRSFPTLNKFTKSVLKKVNKVSKIPSSTNALKKNTETHIRPITHLYIKENNKLHSKEVPQMCKDVQPDSKKNDTTSKYNDGPNNMKTDSVPILLHSPKQNANLKLESSLRGDQNLIANNWNVQLANHTPSFLAQSVHMNAKKASVAKLPFPFPSISSNTSLVSPKTNIQSHLNVLNNNNAIEMQREKIKSVQPLGHIEDGNNQQLSVPEALHSIPIGNTFQSTNQHFPILPLITDRNYIENPRYDTAFQYNKPPPQIQKQPVQNEKVDMTKPPPPTYGNVIQKYHGVRQQFPDAKIIKKTPIQPHNMNMYRPPPNAYTPYPYYYPMTMPRVSDNFGMYTVNNQNYSCLVGPYTLPYDTEIFPHPPPPPPPPPPPTLSPASQQQSQQIFPNTDQLSTQNSIIGRNNAGDIKKINISASLLTKPDVSITQIDSKKGIVKKKNIAENTQHNSKNVNEAVAITPAVTKSEMLKELDSDIQTDKVTVFTHSPKNNLKRPPILFTIREENKKNKPCPLSKKVKVSDPRTLPNKGQINEEPVTKGYSPPILPIPTFENVLSQTHGYDIGLIPDTTVEKPANKNMVFPPRHEHHNQVRKISLDEYKKKSSLPRGKTTENKYRRLDTLVKNLCRK